ncbi:MAG: nucleotidyltransferase domain-containing protein [Tardiphaga sp.]|nr:nucleotidyltransferase domain-containing protein [Tardiphaga sp.]
MTEVANITLDTILTKLRELAPAIKAEGATRLAVFGSWARGDARPDSDLDLLIETFDRTDSTRQFDWSNVMNMIEDSVGIWPHLMYPTELTPRIRERMADDLIEVF